MYNIYIHIAYIYIYVTYIYYRALLLYGVESKNRGFTPFYVHLLKIM